MIAQYAKKVTSFYADGGPIDFIVPRNANIRRHLKTQGCDAQCYHYETVNGYWNGSTFETVDWLNPDKATLAACRKETRRLDAIRDANRAKVRAYHNYIMFAFR